MTRARSVASGVTGIALLLAYETGAHYAVSTPGFEGLGLALVAARGAEQAAHELAHLPFISELEDGGALLERLVQQDRHGLGLGVHEKARRVHDFAVHADLAESQVQRVQDHADWSQPMAPPEGIDTVIVNGRLAIDAGRYTGAKSGRVLRHACPR